MRIRTAFGALVATVAGSLGVVAQTAAPALGIVAATPLVISEFRVRGPSGANDEFVEILNAGGADHTVAASSGTGYSLVASDGVTRCTIPNGTVVPRGGHYLCVNSVAYSLASYPAGNGTTATGDATYTTDIPDNAGLALFDSSTSLVLANRLDAVGSTSEANTLYKEGTGYPALTPFSIDSSFYRRQDATNTVVDADDNAADFVFVDTNGTSAGAGQRLGAPGPENLSSPPGHGSSTLAVGLIDTGAGPYEAPNYVRDLTSAPAQNSTFGTIAIRRVLTNNTGGSITRLRVKLSDQSTFPAPTGLADLRARTSTDTVVSLTGGGTATALATTLEQPPSQPNGSGFNSTLSANTVTLATPLANGASIALNLLFGIQQNGLWRLGLEADALPGGGTSIDLCGQTDMPTPRPAETCELAPVNTVPAARTVPGATSFTGGDFAVTDYDEDSSSKVTLTAANGLLSLSTTGLTFTAGDGTDDATMTFTGLITDINTALDTLVYAATPAYSGPASITITSDDQGHTWPSPHVGVVDGPATDTDVVSLTVVLPELTISEFRVRGPNGANDEFVEIRNGSSGAHTVTASSGTGYAVAASNGVARCVIPNGTVIPGGGHYLCVNSVGYSLASYPAGNGTTATGDATYTTDIPDNAGIALFNTSVAGDFTLANRLDAVGSTSEANTLYKEGTGYPALTPFSIDYSFYRSLGSGEDADTNDNAVDFVFVDTNGTSAGAGQRLGAPGPENLSSPVRRVALGTTPVTRTDVGAGHLLAPNLVRDLTSAPAQNSTFGTVSIRRKVTNNTGAAITRLRFRIREVLTFPAPSGYADLRPLTSTDVVVSLTGGGTTTAKGTTLEQPPSQPNGGGFNSTLSAGTITLATPLANGASTDVQWLFGVQQTGLFRLGVAVESLPGGSSSFVVCGHTDGAFPASATGDVCPQVPDVLVPGTQSTSGVTPVTFTGGTAISVADADDVDTAVTLTAIGGTVSLSGLTGLSFTTGDGTDDATTTFEGALTDVNNALDGLVYTATGGFSGAGSLTVAADDGGSTWPVMGATDPAATDTELVTINVSAVNQPPVNTVPGAQISPEDTDLVFTGGTTIGIADPDAGSSPVEVTVSAANGEITLSGVAELSFTAGDGSSDTTMTFTGTIAAINSALADLIYRPDGDYVGADTLTIVTDDQGATGGPAETDTDTVGLTITEQPELGDFFPLPPARILDTRTGLGAPVGKVGPGGSVILDVTGVGGVPATGVAAVYVNVTETANTTGGYVTVWPSGTPLPSTSNLNYDKGQTKANAMVVRVGADGKIRLRNALGQTHLVVDVLGYSSTALGSGGGVFKPLARPRILDTRSGTGAPAGRIPAGGSLTVQLTGANGIPASGVGAVLVNLTAVTPTVTGFLTVHPADIARPLASNINFQTGKNIANLLVARVSPSGQVKIFNSSGSTHVLFDLVGYYSDGIAPQPTGGALTMLTTPRRVVDTRYGIGSVATPIGPGQSRVIDLAGVGGVPSTGVGSVVVNMTVTRTTGSGYLTQWPNGESRPITSTLNWVRGQTANNYVVAKVGPGGLVQVFNYSGNTHLVADIVGWYSS